MTEALQDLADYVTTAIGGAVLSHEIRRGELAVTIKRDELPRVLTFLRDDSNCQFRQLLDVCGVDYPDREERFDVVYHLLSLRQNQRIRVKLTAGELTPVPSAVSIFKALVSLSISGVTKASRFFE